MIAHRFSTKKLRFGRWIIHGSSSKTNFSFYKQKCHEVVDLRDVYHDVANFLEGQVQVRTWTRILDLFEGGQIEIM